MKKNWREWLKSRKAIRERKWQRQRVDWARELKRFMLERGYSTDDFERKLLKEGWTAEEIAKVFYPNQHRPAK